MRIFIAIFVGLVGGFVLGIALSSFIGIVSMRLLDEPIGIKYLPYYTSILCAVLLPVIDAKSKKGSN